MFEAQRHRSVELNFDVLKEPRSNNAHGAKRRREKSLFKMPARSY